MRTTLARRVAHAALGGPFIWFGFEAATEPGARVAMAADLGIPGAETAVRLNGAAMVAGGLGLTVGVLPRSAALGLAASLVPTTLAGHPFWQDDDPKTRKASRIQFFKNLGLIGGLLAVATAPSAPRPGSG